MQSSDPSVTIGTKFSHFQESSSECDSLQTWASAQAASSSQQIQPAAVSLRPGRVPASPRAWKEQEGCERGDTQGREGGKLWGASAGRARWREGLGRPGRVRESLAW